MTVKAHFVVFEMVDKAKLSQSLLLIALYFNYIKRRRFSNSKHFCFYSTEKHFISQ